MSGTPRVLPTLSSWYDAPKGGSSIINGPDANEIEVLKARLADVEGTIHRLSEAFHSGHRHSSGSHPIIAPPTHRIDPQLHTPSQSSWEQPLDPALAPENDAIMNGESPLAAAFVDLPVPDAISRGILLMDDCQEAFDFYFDRIHPWTMILNPHEDGSAATVRQRSPILFHTIILTVFYYRPTSTTSLVMYRAISTILYSLLGPLLLSSQPPHLFSDTLRAIHLLDLYRPVQYDNLWLSGETSPPAIQYRSKINPQGAWALRNLAGQIVQRMNLPHAGIEFERCSNAGVPTHPSIIADVRLHLALAWHDIHGALSGGSSQHIVPPSIALCRLFAEKRFEKYDVRLAASAELFTLAIKLIRSPTVSPGEVYEFNSSLDQWCGYWQLQLKSNAYYDPYTWSTINMYGAFICLLLNAYALGRSRSWSSLESVTDGQVQYITQVKAGVQRLVLAVTEQKADMGEGFVATRWGSTVSARVWEELELDKDIIDTMQWCGDSVAAVMYPHALILLIRLHTSGLLFPDLITINPHTIPTPQPSIPAGSPLANLLTLGDSILGSIAPNAEHPVGVKANYIRRLRGPFVPEGMASNKFNGSGTRARTPRTSMGAPSLDSPGLAGEGGGKGQEVRDLKSWLEVNFGDKVIFSSGWGPSEI
ncbi:hypothetical protein L198_02921 [Cryptococcus wingfieldii CBS 7118]|uniref:Transcription factor domain-containing protein n=1 Tax=Cryptococcus wingfieldii CBS 7118 TaxID=1295528 RepID=A0A1E3JI90_9TREE|nr:hypothetical protein L198_02921 [Cryptococcus wingfieldii CBS 7118]ODO00601.1 hypothetical protein L198_02921 [Cryptococcus wingfieldii CBS 7118]